MMANSNKYLTTITLTYTGVTNIFVTTTTTTPLGV